MRRRYTQLSVLIDPAHTSLCVQMISSALTSAECAPRPASCSAGPALLCSTPRISRSSHVDVLNKEHALQCMEQRSLEDEA